MKILINVMTILFAFNAFSAESVKAKIELKFYDQTSVKIVKTQNERHFYFCQNEACNRFTVMWVTQARQAKSAGPVRDEKYYLAIIPTLFGAGTGLTIPMGVTASAALPLASVGMIAGLAVIGIWDLLDGKELTQTQVDQIDKFLLAPYVINDASGTINLELSGPEYVEIINQAVNSIRSVIK